MTTASTPSSDTITEKTEVLHGEENVVNTDLQFTFNANSRIDACVDYTRPSLAIGIEQIKKAFVDAKSRGVKLRYLTEITSENISFCKELISMVDEISTCRGNQRNFMISETEYLAPSILYRKGKPASQIIYSNVKEL